MNKNAIIGGVVVLVVIVAAVLYFSGSNVTLPGGLGGKQGTLRELYAQGGSQKCTVSSNQNGTQLQGTVYVGINKLRGDFTSTSGATTVKNHVVISNGITYVWTEGITQGFRVAYDANAASGGSSQAIDTSLAMRYSCAPWTTNGIEFDLPNNVNFQDITSVTTPNPTSNGAGATNETTTTVKGTAAQCAACNAETSAQAKAQCLVALSC